MNCSLASIRQSRASALVRLVLVVLLVSAGQVSALAQARRAAPAQLEAAREYIRKSWRTLMRSNRDLAAAAVDPKFKPAGPASAHRWPVYVARGENLAAVERTLRAQMRREDFARIELRRLPARGWEAEPGLLYLPRPYVVPGGRFDEMYGWDSYFIQVGLVRDGETALARDMVENFLYEVEHYGQVLNANRTYYLTRSQPPFLTRMILGVYARTRDARAWERRASERRERVNRLMWDERDGLYYDYNFISREVRRYPFVTTFYPLWAGIATEEQAARVVSNLRLFERAGGLQTSTSRSGSQWDAPYGWAPMQLIAVEGVGRYGYSAEADRVSVNFLSLVLKEFVEHNTIVEKYDVERRTSTLGEGLRFGYTSNEIGFGWTNAAFTELYARLPPPARLKVLEPDGVGVP